MAKKVKGKQAKQTAVTEDTQTTTQTPSTSVSGDFTALNNAYSNLSATGTTGTSDAAGAAKKQKIPETPYTVLQYTPQTYSLGTTPDVEDYNSPQYSDTYREGINTQYYTDAVNKYKEYAEKNRANQLGEAQKNQTNALKNAYVTRLQNERKMQKAMANAGIRGGATETAMLNLANQYGTARSAANTDYTNSVNSINSSIDDNIFQYQNDMDARAEEYIQNLAQSKWQADREAYANGWNARNDAKWNVWNATNEMNAANTASQNDAQKAYYEGLNNAFVNKYNADREDEQNANANAEKGTVNYYTNFYSQKSNKELNKIINQAQKEIKKLRKGGVTAKEKKKIQTLKNKQAGAAAAKANK